MEQEINNIEDMHPGRYYYCIQKSKPEESYIVLLHSVRSGQDDIWRRVTYCIHEKRLFNDHNDIHVATNFGSFSNNKIFEASERQIKLVEDLYLSKFGEPIPDKYKDHIINDSYTLI